MPMTETGQQLEQAPQRLDSPQPRRRGRRQRPPSPRRWMAALAACLTVLALIAVLLRPWERFGPVADVDASAPPSDAPTLDAVAPTVPPEDPAPSPVSPAEPLDSDAWFSDAVFIGDSRVDGLQLYSGITTKATFLEHTGLTVYEVRDGKKVIRRDGQKISVLDALSGESYGKVYIALGINELGYFDPTGFAETFGEVVERVKELLPDAKIYIQSLIPVNTEKCKANDAAYYITNEGIASYNEALAAYFADKEVYLLGVPETLVDENGEMLSEYCADGVHFKKDGYVLWRSYLEAHTEG